MRRILMLLISTAMLLLIVTGCNNKSVTYGGVNAEILEISEEVKGMLVKSLDQNCILGEKCYINCEDETVTFIFVNNNTEEIIDLDFNDFVVGDEIALDVISVGNKYALVSQVQLLTQRK